MKTFIKLFSVIVACALFLPTSSPAQEQGQDSPYIGRIPGYTINNYMQQFDRMVPWGEDRTDLPPVMGTYTEIEYRAEENARQSPLAISMVYTNTLQDMGAEILGSGDNWGSYLLHADGKNIYIKLNIWSSGSYYGLYILEEGGLNLQLTPPSGATDSVSQAPSAEVPALALTPPSQSSDSAPANSADSALSSADLAMLSLLFGGGDCNFLGNAMELGLLVEQMGTTNPQRLDELNPQLEALSTEMDALGDDLFTNLDKTNELCLKMSDLIVQLQQ